MPVLSTHAPDASATARTRLAPARMIPRRGNAAPPRPPWPRTTITMFQLATLLFTLLATFLAICAHPTCAHSVDTPADDLASLSILATPARLAVVRPGVASAYTPLHKRATRAVHADDHLRVTLDAYNATFVLHLAPDTHLVHPDAVVEVVKDGKTVTKPLRARVYAGHVVAQGAQEEEEMVWTTTGKGHGRARMVLYHDGLTDDPDYGHHYTSTRVPIFAAEWTAFGETYRADPIHAYLRHKRPHDPLLPASRHLRARDPRLADATMVLYRDSDTVGARSHQQHLLSRRDEPVAAGECGNMQFGEWNRAFRAQWAADRADRASTRLRSRAPSSNCPTDPSFVYMGVAADCSYTATFKGSEKDIINELITVWGTVSSKYQDTFNVGVGIVRTVLRMDCGGAEPWNRDCATTAYQISDRLSDFSKWRGDQKTDEGLWHLLSKCNTGATLGIAWTGTLCETSTRDQPKSATPGSGSSQLSAISSGTGGDREYVTGAGVSTITRDQWKVVAHEIGHNFGAIHDCIASQCSAGAQDCSPCTSAAGNGTSSGSCDCAGRFLMNPTDNSATNQFSPGSVDDICRHVTKVAKSMGAKSCLLKPGARKLLQGNVCGNGVLEEGEQCDCGDRCAQDACCTAQCTLKPNAQCSDRNSPGCCAQCKFKPAGSVCRPAHEFCDVAETCSGTSAECPKDTYLPDGTTCTLNGTVPAESAANSYCASGLCTNRDAQCFLASKGQATVFRTACAPRQGECQITCQVGNATNQCSEFNAVFLDGTDCGLGGRCQAGQCSGSSILNSVSGWIKGNPTLAYVVAAAIGLAVLMCAWSCVLRPAADKCCRRAGKKKVPIPPPARPSDTAAAPVAPVAAVAASTEPATAADARPMANGAPSPGWSRPSPTAPQGPPGYPQPPSMASAPPAPPGYPQPPPVAPVPVTADMSDASSGYSASRPTGRPYENAPRPPYDAPRPHESSTTRPYEIPTRLYDVPRPQYDAPRPSASPTRPYENATRPFDAPRPSGTSPRMYDAPRSSPYETRRPSETSARGYETSRPSYDASPRLGYGAPLQQQQPYGYASRLPQPRPGGGAGAYDRDRSGSRSGSVPRGGSGYGWKPS
ncbi:hypothetical protein AMAG_10162, partial [Allomyces macrogynus ATCC 38327]